MDNDNVYPASSRHYFPKTPSHQTKAQEDARAEVLKQLPVLKKILTRLDKRIAHYDSIDSIEVDLDKDPELFQRTHAVNKAVKSALIGERKFLETQLNKLTEI